MQTPLQFTIFAERGQAGQRCLSMCVRAPSPAILPCLFGVSSEMSGASRLAAVKQQNHISSNTIRFISLHFLSHLEIHKKKQILSL
jgi:hypothetical protein